MASNDTHLMKRQRPPWKHEILLCLIFTGKSSEFVTIISHSIKVLLEHILVM